MTAQSPSVESIFSAALEIVAPHERAAYLEGVCGGDAVLRARIDALLKADADAGSFLDKPITGVGATNSAMADETERENSGTWATELTFLAPCDKPGHLGTLCGKADEYEIVEMVGRGGMGAVLRAFDTKLSRIVAVKVMAPALAANPTAVKRFLREARAAAAVHHDNVVTIHAIDDTHQPPFLVMEFIEGATLGQKIERQGALGLVHVLRIGSQIAAGLAAAHKLGLIHRDVKPGNILLQNGVERVKITDFGLARAADDLEMTQPGLIAGTPQYMSPEQAKGEPIDTRSDLFSLGSVLYAMCTGRPAFRAETTMGVLRRVCEDAPRSIPEVNPEIPRWLEAVVLKLLAKNPADRFQTAAEVTELLSQHLAHLNNPAQAPRPATVVLLSGDQPAASNRSRRIVTRTGLSLVICFLIVVFVASIGINPALTWLQSRRSDARVASPQNPSLANGRMPALAKAQPVSADLSQRMQAMPAPFATGKWSIEGDALVTEGIHKQSQIIVFGDPSWSDYDLRVEVIDDKEDPTGAKSMANSIVFLADERGTNRWHVDIGAFSKPVHFDLVPFVADEDGWKSPARRWIADRLHGKYGVWYTVEVEVRQSKVTVIVDGDIVAVSEHPKLLQGRVGAASYHVGHSRWRNFEVRSPAGELLWQGLPRIPNDDN